MIKYAGIGVAVSNGVDEVKKQADYVTKACYGDGIAEAIRIFILEHRGDDMDEE